MKPSLQNYDSHRPWDLFFILVLLCLFAFSALLLVGYGAHIYDNIARDTEENADLRLPLSYVATKVRQHDSAAAVHLAEKEGRTALVLESIDGGAPVETWIYYDNEMIYEVYIDQGADFDLADGIAVMPSNGLGFALRSDGLLTVTAENKQGQTLSLSLALHSAGLEGGASYD